MLSGATSYDFNGVDIGTPSADRIVVVVIQTEGSGPGLGLDSATIGGVAADVRIATNSGAGGDVITAIVSRALPTGTTADISVTFTEGTSRCGIGVWALTGAEETPVDSDSDGSLTGGTGLSMTVDIPANGCAIAGDTHGQGGTTTTWGGATGRYSESPAGNSYFAGADVQPTGSDRDSHSVTTSHSSTAADIAAAVVVWEEAVLSVDAGSDQALALPGAVTLDATVSGSPDSTLWTTVGGPGLVEFEDEEAVDTVVAFSTPGVYRLRLTATLGAVTAFDDLVVTVTSAPQAAEAAVITQGYPKILETIMTILDGWTPITPEDLNVYQDTIEALEKTLGAGASNAVQSQFGPKGGNVDLAQRLNRFLEQDGGLQDVAYVTGTAELGEFSENTGGKVIAFGKNLSGVGTAANNYHVLFSCKSPGVEGSLYVTDVPALWWTDFKLQGSVVIYARTLEGDAIAVGDDTQVVWGLLAIGYGAFATGVL